MRRITYTDVAEAIAQALDGPEQRARCDHLYLAYLALEPNPESIRERMRILRAALERRIAADQQKK